MSITVGGEKVGVGYTTVNTVAFNKDDKLIAAGGASSVVLIDAATGKTVNKIRGLGGVVHVNFGKKSNLLAVACADHTIRIVDVNTGTTIHTLRGHENEVRSVQFTSDDKFLVSGSLDTQIRIWDLTSGKMV